MTITSAIRNWTYMTKPWIHVIGGLGIWIFALAVMVMEQNNTVTLKLDQVKTYQFQKVPSDWDGTYNLLVNYIVANWQPADDDGAVRGCMSIVNLTASDAACFTKRKNMVLQARQMLQCDKYRSPFCYCVNQITKGLANDIGTQATRAFPGATYPFNTPGVNTFDGVTFANENRNMSGQRANVIKGIEACHYLQHGTQVAKQTSTTLLRRTHLLFILTTLVTGNIAYNQFLLPLAHAAYFTGFSAVMRFLFIIIWPIVGLATSIMMEQGTQTLLMWVAIPPLIHLIWYEFLLPNLKHEPLIHPFMFNLMLAVITLISLIENGVVDYDNLFVEIWKAHMISYLYFGTCWFHLFMDNDMDPKKSNYLKKPAQDTIYISVVLALLSSLTTVMAPYTQSLNANYIYWIPNVFTLAAFIAVIWINQMDRFSDFLSNGVHKGKYESISEKYWYVPNGNMYVSSFLLAITALVTVFYWRDFSVVIYSVWQKYATRTIQYAPDITWLNPAV